MKHFLDALERKRAVAQGWLRCRRKVRARVKQAELFHPSEGSAKSL